MRRLMLALGMATLVLGGITAIGRAQNPDHAEYLYKGKLKDGEKALLEHLTKTPGDDRARFGLGTIQFFEAVEHLGASFYKKGLRHHSGIADIPLLRLPVPPNPNPEPITYQDLRKIFANLVSDLAKAEATLAPIKDESVKLPIRLQKVQLDLKGNGDLVGFDEILGHYAGGGVRARDDGFLVHFDRGDVAWLRGYCHLIMAMSEAILAYNFDDLFQSTAHVYFKKAKTSFEQLGKFSNPTGGFLGGEIDITDLIAIIHLIRFPVEDARRLASSREHLLQVFALSRESWKYILAEKDDDYEWIPNPDQQKGVTGIPVRREMVQTWLAFIGEAEDLVEGKKLIPFWRGPPDMGINLKKVFTEPRQFDLVLWIQGSNAIPFLEKGTLTSPDVWRRLERVFQGDLFRFGAWFN